MLVILLFAILTVCTAIAFRRGDHTAHATGAKVTLAICYLLLVMQSVEIEHAATQADKMRIAGGTNGWFGTYWALAWLVNLLAVIGLHIYLLRSKSAKDTPNAIIA